MMRKMELKREAGAMLAVLILAAGSIWPVIKRPATAFAYGGDDAIITWYLNQTIQKIPNRLGEIFTGNIFYPEKNTMAFGVMMVPSAVLAYWPAKILGTHVAAFNTALIIGQLSTWIILYLWLKEMSGSRWGAVAATTAFGLSAFRMQFVVHIHFWTMQWLVLAMYMTWRWVRKGGGVWQLYIAAACGAIQAWESIYQAYWIAGWMAVWLIPQWRRLVPIRKHLLIMGAAGMAVVWPVAKVYTEVAKTYGFAGSIREAAHFSMSAEEMWGRWSSPGLYVLLIVTVIKIFKQEKSFKEARWLTLLMAVGIILALGPVLKWQERTVKIGGRWPIPLPYGLAYYIIPGVAFLRSVHRYVWLAGLAAAGLIAIGLKATTPKIRKAGVAGVMLAAIAGGNWVKSRADFPKPSNYPAVYQWLKQQPGQVIVEYPVYNWDSWQHGQEMYRMVFSLEHGKKLIGGASGFLPSDRAALLGRISEKLPSPEINDELKQLGVNYVIVHTDQMDETKKNEMTNYRGWKRVWQDPTAQVFEW